MAARRSQRSRSGALRPCASCPKTHAVGAPSRSRSPKTEWGDAGSAPITCRPAARAAPTASAKETPVTTGRWKSEPAVARTTLGLVTSTLPWQATTAAAPAASAIRMRVPALPGSETRGNRTASRAPSSTSRPGGGGIVATARMPWASGLIAAATSAVTRWRYSPAARARDTVARSRAATASVTYTSRTRPGAWETSSRTAWGPSTRNWRCRWRAERLDSPATFPTRVDRGLSRTSRRSVMRLVRPRER